MNIERDKFLTEAMGECWRSKQKWSGPKGTEYRNPYPPNNDFSTPNGFFKLWNWAQQQEWWFSFWKNDFGVPIVKANLIHPDRFANAVYEFLKERVK